MRTKITILSAAALAAGLLSSNAQVYSANVVGYYNITVPAAKKAYISMQLPGGAAGDNMLVNGQLTNGIPDGSSLGYWNGVTFAPVLTYFAGFGWFDPDSNFATNTLRPGQGALFINADTVNPCTITVVGTVPQGTQTNDITTLRNFYSMPAPLVTNLDSTLANFPSADGDTYLEWDIASQSFPASKTYTYFLGFGWFDAGSTQVFPSPQVGKSFFYVNTGPATKWVFNFTVQ
jgi:hypothetical protein